MEITTTTTSENPTEHDLRVKALEFATKQYGAQTFTADQAVARATAFLRFLKSGA